MPLNKFETLSCKLEVDIQKMRNGLTSKLNITVGQVGDAADMVRTIYILTNLPEIYEHVSNTPFVYNLPWP